MVQHKWEQEKGRCELSVIMCLSICFECDLIAGGTSIFSYELVHGIGYKAI